MNTKISNTTWVKNLFKWANANNITGKTWGKQAGRQWGVEVENIEDVRVGLPRNKALLLKLTKLNLSRECLTSLPKEIGNLSNLTHLNLEYNHLIELPKEISNLKSLVYLNLKINTFYDNKINKENHLWKHIVNIPSLKYLNIQSCYTTSGIPKEIANLQNLTFLNISWNNFSYMPKELTTLKNLKGLDASGNEFKKIPSEISYLTKLNFLHLSGNNLATIPEALWELKNLETLNLCWNNLETLDKNISSLTHLSQLNLSGNCFINLPKELGNLRKLEVLNLYDNALTHLPKELGRLLKLRVLDVKDNPLKEIPTEISSLSHLKDFNPALLLEKEEVKEEKPLIKTEEKVEEKTKKIIPPIIKAENTLYFGLSGTGKSYALVQRIKDFDKHILLSFHANYSYEDFVESKEHNGIFKTLCEEAKANPHQFFAVFIEEIHTVDIAKVFGEILTLMDISQREVLYTHLPYSRVNFTIPKNLSILATLNTSHTNLSHLDIGLRRKFNFVECPIDYSLLEDEEKIENIDMAQLLKAINTRITYLYDETHCIGHGYLMNIQNFEALVSIMRVQIIPFLMAISHHNKEHIDAILNHIDREDLSIENLQHIYAKEE